jgi:hypothetical protein
MVRWQKAPFGRLAQLVRAPALQQPVLVFKLAFSRQSTAIQLIISNLHPCYPIRRLLR